MIVAAKYGFQIRSPNREEGASDFLTALDPNEKAKKTENSEDNTIPSAARFFLFPKKSFEESVFIKISLTSNDVRVKKFELFVASSGISTGFPRVKPKFWFEY